MGFKTQPSLKEVSHSWLTGYQITISTNILDREKRFGITDPQTVIPQSGGGFLKGVATLTYGFLCVMC